MRLMNAARHGANYCFWLNLVKFFVSSRDDHDIVHLLPNSPNLYNNSNDNGKDIERFVHSQLDQRIKDEMLLYGVVSQSLKDHIIETLIAKANGMLGHLAAAYGIICTTSCISSGSPVHYWRIRAFPAMALPERQARASLIVLQSHSSGGSHDSSSEYNEVKTNGSGEKGVVV